MTALEIRMLCWLLQAAFQRTHDGQRTDGEYQRAGDEALGDGAAVAFLLQRVTQTVDGGVNVQQLADDGADHHGKNGDQGAAAFHQSGYGDAYCDQRQRGHNGAAQALRQQLSGKHTHQAAYYDSGAIDKGTQ